MVSGTKVPYGPLYEGLGGRSSFRHPLLGNRDHWYTQETRPFLQPAVDARRDEIVQRAEEAVEKAIRAAASSLL
jgi:hypothetical protein